MTNDRGDQTMNNGAQDALLKFGWVVFFAQSKTGVKSCKNLAKAAMLRMRDRVRNRFDKSVEELAEQIDINVGNVIPRELKMNPAQILQRSVVMDWDCTTIYPRNEKWISLVTEQLLLRGCVSCNGLEDICATCQRTSYECRLFAKYWACRYRISPFEMLNSVSWCSEAFSEVVDEYVAAKLNDPTVKSVNEIAATKHVKSAVESISGKVLQRFRAINDEKRDEYLEKILQGGGDSEHH